MIIFVPDFGINGIWISMFTSISAFCNAGLDIIGDVKVCPDCGGELIIRKDDNAETVKERLAVYQKQTLPLIEYYSAQGKLLTVDGDKDIQAVFNEIVKVLAND